MTQIRTLALSLFLLLPAFLSSQSTDYVTGFGFNTFPNALAPLSGDRWLAVCTGSPVPGDLFHDTVAVVVFDSGGAVLSQTRLTLPVSEVYNVRSAVATPGGGFAVAIARDYCDAGLNDNSLLVFDANAGLKWSKHAHGLPVILKISPGGQLVGVGDYGGPMVEYDLETGQVLRTLNFYDNGEFSNISDFEFLDGWYAFLAIGGPSFQSWEKLDSATYYLSYSKRIEPFGYPVKIVADSLTGARYTFDYGIDGRLFIFDQVSLEYTELADYPFSILDLVATKSNLVALAGNDSSVFLINLDFQGAILDTIRTFPPLLKARQISYRNGVLAVAGINGSGPSMLNDPWEPFNANQLWLHTNHLDDTPDAVTADVALTQIAQNAPVVIDSFFSSGTGNYVYQMSGGQFRMQVKNSGETLLESVDINVSFEWVFNFVCGYRPAKKVHYSGLSVLPDESVWLDFGDIQASSQPYRLSQLCFWTSAPNHKPDAHPEDDTFCKSLNSTGTKEPDHEAFKVTPNPADAFVQVLFPAIPGAGFWKMFDVAGKQVKAGEIESSLTQLRIDTADLSPGMYLLSVNGQGVKVMVERQ